MLVALLWVAVILRLDLLAPMKKLRSSRLHVDFSLRIIDRCERPNCTKTFSEHFKPNLLWAWWIMLGAFFFVFTEKIYVRTILKFSFSLFNGNYVNYFMFLRIVCLLTCWNSPVILLYCQCKGFVLHITTIFVIKQSRSRSIANQFFNIWKRKQMKTHV